MVFPKIPGRDPQARKEKKMIEHTKGEWRYDIDGDRNIYSDNPEWPVVAQAPKETPSDPLGELFEKVSKIANAALAKEITADEWEAQIEEVTKGMQK